MMHRCRLILKDNELATSLTKSASLNAHPYRSPRGHEQAKAMQKDSPFLLFIPIATCKHGM